MSLYEPSVRSSSWSTYSRHLSRRFTTLEGWREVGAGVFTMNSKFRMFSDRHEFDPENFRNNHTPSPNVEVSRASRDVSKDVSRVQSYENWPRTSMGTIGKAMGSVRDTKLPMVEERVSQEKPYYAFLRKEKWTLVIIVGAAAALPALTTNVYLPTLNDISRELNIGLDAVSLTITSYFIGQGIASPIWIPLANTIGRRSVYIYSLIIYIITSILLSFSPNFAVLFVFRGLQAVSIASTVSIGSAIIQDISVPPEQDGFDSFCQSIRNVTIVLAPIFGGLLSNFLGFRCIFVILFGLSLALLLVLLFFLPETLRSIGGNGSLPLRGIHQPLVWKFKIFGKPAHVDEQSDPGVSPKLEARAFIEPLLLFREKDIMLSLVFSGTVFAIWTMVTVSTAGLFQRAFRLNELLLGLVFIPNGLGTIAGSTLIRNLLNRDFITATSSYKASRSLPPSTIISTKSLPAYFPLEHARLVRLPMVACIFVIALSFYGFTLSHSFLTSKPGWILIPLVLQFLVAATANAICEIHKTLIADLWSRNAASSEAVSNLVKCLFAAVGVAVVQQFIRGVGVGPAFLALSLVVVVLIPLPIVQWYWGGDWRRERDSRDLNDMVGP